MKKIFQDKSIENQTTEVKENTSPSIEEIEASKKISRDEAIKSVDRIKLENKNIKGSISLEGGIIDDVTFKNYKKSLDSDEKVVFLNPKNSSDGYYIESGWASSSKDNLKLPVDKTIWKVKGNNFLKPNNPITIEWDNNEGLIFTVYICELYIIF